MTNTTNTTNTIELDALKGWTQNAKGNYTQGQALVYQKDEFWKFKLDEHWYCDQFGSAEDAATHAIARQSKPKYTETREIEGVTFTVLSLSKEERGILDCTAQFANWPLVPDYQKKLLESPGFKIEYEECNVYHRTIATVIEIAFGVSIEQTRLGWEYHCRNRLHPMLFSCVDNALVQAARDKQTFGF